MTRLSDWTVEETDFISCFWKKNIKKQELMGKIRNAVPFMEPGMRELAEKVTDRLGCIPEREYVEMAFFHTMVKMDREE